MYAKIIESVGGQLYEKDHIWSIGRLEFGRELGRDDGYRPYQPRESLALAQDCLVVRCPDWKLAMAVAKACFEQVPLKTNEEEFYYVWTRSIVMTKDMPRVGGGVLKDQEQVDGYRVSPHVDNRRDVPHYNRQSEAWNILRYVKLCFRDIIRYKGKPLLRVFGGYYERYPLPAPEVFESARKQIDILTGKSRRLENHMTPGKFDHIEIDPEIRGKWPPPDAPPPEHET